MDLFQKLSKLNELTPDLIEKANIYRNDPHSAKIKPEFISFQSNSVTKQENPQENSDQKTELVDEENISKHSLNENEKSESINKRIKIGDNRKKDEKVLKKIREKKLCPSITRGFKCNYAESCKYRHDLKSYMETKAKDIDTTCYVFRKYGKCPFGITCRFSSDHVVFKDDVYVNVVNEEKIKELSEGSAKTCQIYNVLTSELKTKLWKKKVDFKKTEKILDTVNKYLKSSQGLSLKYSRHKGLVQRQEDTKPKDEVKRDEENQESNGNEKKIGLVTDEDLIKLRGCEKKKIDWKNKLYLAPLTTAGNLPFRRICKEFGADITCSEMAMGTNLLTGQASEWALLKKHESEDIFGVQLAGSYPDTLTKASQIIRENCAIDFIDINCGCPIDIVFNKGAGCALMSRLENLQKIVYSLDTLLDIPVTVKIRTGIKEDLLIAHDLVPELKKWGASMITLHGRTRQQRYSKLADWNYIDKCAKLSDPVPLFGCGDILSHHDYYDHIENTSISGCMIARGALYKPWLFTEIKERRDWDISAGERFDILKKFVNYGLDHWGSDTIGVETTRRFLLEWLSFFYRYIPVGLMETLPQRINLRPPYFFGRNELETLMASQNCSDWLKISEMLLGPVPDNYQFTPKHKANAF